MWLCAFGWHMAEAIETKRISELSEDLQLVTGSHARDVIEHIEPQYSSSFQIAFVDVSNGDYSEVWVASGCVPKTHKVAYRLR